MIILVGVVLLVAAVVVGAAAVSSNTGAAHTLTDDFTVLGYHATGTTGILFLWAAVLGAVGMLGLMLLVAGTFRSSRRLREAKADLRLARRGGPADRAPRPADEPTPAALTKEPRTAPARGSWRNPFRGRSFGHRSADPAHR
ncbi:hypothetical protein [Nocardia thailandica]